MLGELSQEKGQSDLATHVLYFGKNCNKDSLFKPSLNGKCLEWVESWPYLGVTICSGTRFDCNIRETLKKFYKCSNAIFRIDGNPSDMTLLRIVESHCVPILSYAIEAIVVCDAAEKRQLRVAYNSVFRKIFGYRFSESVRELQGQLSRPTWEELVEKRVSNFLSKLSMSNNILKTIPF